MDTAIYQRTSFPGNHAQHHSLGRSLSCYCPSFYLVLITVQLSSFSQCISNLKNYKWSDNIKDSNATLEFHRFLIWIKGIGGGRYCLRIPISALFVDLICKPRKWKGYIHCECEKNVTIPISSEKLPSCLICSQTVKACLLCVTLCVRQKAKVSTTSFWEQMARWQV